MKTLKKIPMFKDEAHEAAFWAEHDSAEYIDYANARRVIFPNLKPSLRTISIRLPESLIEHLKVLANKRDIPYQSLMKIFLAEKVEEEMHPGRR
jgi:predicted DNA binding CopG/RHH family protein